jgi:hypothetical protein
MTDEEVKKLTTIYRHVRQIALSSPYITTDPSEACLFVPSVDVSCWCENCMDSVKAANIETMHPGSQAVQSKLSALPYWNQGRITVEA